MLYFPRKTNSGGLILNLTLKEKTMERVTGIGGVFFKVEDPEKTREWYKEHLGLNTDEYGSNFEWRQADEGELKGFTQWSPFKETSDYFDEQFMINYRVTDLEALVAELEAKGVTVVDEIETQGYGKFVHIIDNDGTRVELWEPNDIEYDKMVGEGRTK